MQWREGRGPRTATRFPFGTTGHRYDGALSLETPPEEPPLPRRRPHVPFPPPSSSSSLPFLDGTSSLVTRTHVRSRRTPARRNSNHRHSRRRPSSWDRPSRQHGRVKAGGSGKAAQCRSTRTSTGAGGAGGRRCAASSWSFSRASHRGSDTIGALTARAAIGQQNSTSNQPISN